MDVRYLAECPEVIPDLVAWFGADWPGVAAADVEWRFRHCAQELEIPIGLVAFERSSPVGTVQLLPHSVHSHDHLGPWVAGLYVVPERRHEGIAAALIDAAVDTAHRRGIDTVYIGIQAAREFYERRGWAFLGDGMAGGEPVMVMSRSLGDAGVSNA